MALAPGPQQPIFALVAIGAGLAAGAEGAANGHYTSAAFDFAGAALGGAGLLAKLQGLYLAARAEQITADSFMSAADQQELLRLIALHRTYRLGSEAFFAAERGYNLSAEVLALLTKGIKVEGQCP